MYTIGTNVDIDKLRSRIENLRSRLERELIQNGFRITDGIIDLSQELDVHISRYTVLDMGTRMGTREDGTSGTRHSA